MVSIVHRTWGGMQGGTLCRPYQMWCLLEASDTRWPVYAAATASFAMRLAARWNRRFSDRQSRHNVPACSE